MIGVFIDTFVVLTMTALVIISSLYTGNGILANTIGNPEAYIAATSGAEAIVSKGNAMQQAFTSTLPALGNFGNLFVAVCLLFFAFSTILSWNFFGKINVQYLFGKKAKIAVVIYSVISIAFIFLGSLLQNDLVWELTDFFNYLMGDFSSDAQFMNYVYNMKVRSIIDIPVPINETDDIITLSTCSYEYTDFRTVVCVRKIRNNEKVNDYINAKANGDTLSDKDVYKYIDEFITVEIGNRVDKYIADIRKIYNSNKDRIEFKVICSDGRIVY